MPSLTVNYYAYGRRGRRHSSAAVVSVAPSLASTPVANTSAAVNAFDISGFPTFAFWSITGETTGGRISRNRFESVAAADAPLIATAWYLPPGGPGDGNGVAGTGIDAFDVDHGSFFDDDFVSVAPDAGLSAAANYDGFVPSTALETITAFSPCHEAVTGGNIPFQSWIVIDGNPGVAGTALTADAGSNSTAFAFYHQPAGLILPPVDDHALTWIMILGSVLVDGGGIGIKPGGGVSPIGPWGPMLSRLQPAERDVLYGLALNAIAGNLDAKDIGHQLRQLGLHLSTDAIKRLNAGAKRGIE